MKKIIVLFVALLIGAGAYADILYVESNVNMENYWQKNDKHVQKVTEVGYKIIKANNLKRAPIVVDRTPKVINAFSQLYNKKVFISTGILPYLDNDDELAYIVAHEISHSMEAYDGLMKVNAMTYNPKKYEYKADLNGIDYMVKAGYNPIAAIIAANKIFGEPLWDWGFLSTHPKGSNRMLEMYKYIYVKYPQYLTSTMTKNIVYANFFNAQSDEIKRFEQKQKKRQMHQESI